MHMGSTLRDLESFLSNLIQLPITEIYLEREGEIKELLEDLSKYPFDPINKFKNIKENKDLAIDEIRGAAQRYIYGNFVDSIFCSCFSVEFSLIIRLDQILSEAEKRNVPKPFTLGEIINWASPASRRNPYGKDILDNETRKAARDIQKLRNAHIHGSNFIAALLLSYRSTLELLNKVGIDLDTVEQGLELLSKILPKDAKEAVLKRYEPSDIVESFNAIKRLSTFEWCANKRLLKSVKKESDEMITNIASSLVQGDFENLKIYFQQDYLLKKRAFRAIKLAHFILSKIEIF